MAKRSEKSGHVAGFSIMGVVGVATLTLVILNFIMMEENKKDLQFIKNSIPPSSGMPMAMRRR